MMMGTGVTFFPLTFFTLDILHKYITKTNHHVGLVHRAVQSGSRWETGNDKGRTQQTGAPPQPLLKFTSFKINSVTHP